MSRPIKFRAWDEQTHSMVHFGLPDVQLNLFSIREIASRENWSNPLMEFTGLFDKNGREVWEGDIVRVLHTDWPSQPAGDPRTLDEYLISISDTGCVTHDADTGGFAVQYRGRFGPEFGRLKPGRHGRLEVIGNRWESPELLEQIEND